MRPSEYTLKHIVWPLQQAAFYRTQGVLPHPLAAVFIRAGDKFIEARPLSVDDHFAELAPVAAAMGVKHVYLGRLARSHCRSNGQVRLKLHIPLYRLEQARVGPGHGRRLKGNGFVAHVGAGAPGCGRHFYHSSGGCHGGHPVQQLGETW